MILSGKDLASRLKENMRSYVKDLEKVKIDAKINQKINNITNISSNFRSQFMIS